MKRVFLSLVIVLLATTTYFSQGKVPPNPFGLEMDEPVGWYSLDKALIAKSLKRIELREETLKKFLDQNEGRQLLFGYIKFKQDSFTGMNPKIEARVLRIRSSRPINFAEFKPLAESTLRKIAGGFNDQRYVVEPAEVEIGTTRAIYHISEFSIRARNGEIHRIRSRTYLIPRGTYFFQISFVDEPGENDLSAEFDKLVNSIKIQN